MDNLFPENLYHSYIVEGNPENISQDLFKLLVKRGEIKKDSPDVFMQIYDSFSIDDSRNVKKWHSELAIGDSKRICIIGTNFINYDAERSLLKMIEEPAVNTHIFIVIPNSLLLLDTIRSRAHIVNTKNKNKNNINKKVNEFLSFNKIEKIDFITKFIKKNKNDLTNSKQRSEAILFINKIEKIYFKKFQIDKKDKKIQFILKELQEKRKYLNLPGASVKMILEHLSLVL